VSSCFRAFLLPHCGDQTLDLLGYGPVDGERSEVGHQVGLELAAIGRERGCLSTDGVEMEEQSLANLGNG
jgi:hypothetical protein